MVFDFASDNAAGIDPRILAAIAACDTGPAAPYGADAYSSRLDNVYSELLGHQAFVFPTPTGTSANGLALGAVCPPYGAVMCHAQSHVVLTECGAPEFFTNGARLVLIAGADHKIRPDALSEALAPFATRNLHRHRASCLSFAQATDGGTIYSLDEIAALAEIAHRHGMKVHMDGARFANAMVSLETTAADMTWRAGVDILSFGTTKNGTMTGEAVIAFDADTAEILRYMHKRAGFLYSKMRFTAVQLLAYLEDDLWTGNARRANGTARRLAAAILKVPGASLAHEVQVNQVFAHLPAKAAEALARAGLSLRPWAHPAGDLYRLVASYRDEEELIRRFEDALKTI